MFLLLIGALVSLTIPTFMYLAGASDLTRHVYGCIPQGELVHCHPSENQFDSLATTGQVQKVSSVNQTSIDPAEGVFGNSLAVNGYRQVYLTIPNKPEMDSKSFSVSFWLKQDPAYVANSAIISHVNAKKNAGWFVQLNATKSPKAIQFSVTNSDGKIFTVSSPFETGVFQNVVGTFDENELKMYFNGNLIESTKFNGSYTTNPDVPLNVGLNSYNYGAPWTGTIDELRFYDRAISENEIQQLANYGDYLQLRAAHNERLTGYWPFDEGLMDKSGSGNDGELNLLATSMAFSPDGRLFYSVRDAGEINIAKPVSKVLKEPFVRLQDPSTNAHQDIMGITLDPNFATNHFVYAYVIVTDANSGTSSGRVIRFTELDNKATDQKILIDDIPTRGGTYLAGALAFGPDDKLYVSTGYTTEIKQGQNSNLTGKVLRINRDGTIPIDNQFPNSLVYTTGHRSMYGIAFDNKKAMAIVAENDPRYHDEINVLKKGGFYGFPDHSSSLSPTSSRLQIDNASAIKPTRTYNPPIIPTQVIFYDHNKFPALKGKFLVVSYGERSVYAITLNSNGSISEELAIRLPDTRGYLVSIAKSPEGDIYVGGENLYKLESIDRTRNKLMYFVSVNSPKNIELADLTANLTAKEFVIDIVNKNNNGTLTTSAQTSLTLQVRIPKIMLGGIYDVTSQNNNQSSNGPDQVIESFKIKETMRVTNAGDTIVSIVLKPNIPDQYGNKILIRGSTSSLVQAASRPIAILR